MENTVKYVQNIWSNTNRWHRVLTIFALTELGVVPGRQMGFQCKDSNLSYPFTGDTVNWKWILAISAFLPLIIMLMVERLVETDTKSYAHSRRLVSAWYRHYLYTWLLHMTLVQIIKRLVGAPRPHFFDTCMPEEAQTCQESEWVSSYHCTKAHWLSQSDRSFPSGHASLAVHAAAFVIWFAHVRGLREPVPVRVACVLRAGGVVCACAAVACALSRIIDRRHHARDVLAGAAIGVAAFFYTVMLCKRQRISTPIASDDAALTSNENTSDTSIYNSFHTSSNNSAHNYDSNSKNSAQISDHNAQCNYTSESKYKTADSNTAISANFA